MRTIIISGLDTNSHNKDHTNAHINLTNRSTLYGKGLDTLDNLQTRTIHTNAYYVDKQ